MRGEVERGYLVTTLTPLLARARVARPVALGSVGGALAGKPYGWMIVPVTGGWVVMGGGGGGIDELTCAWLPADGWVAMPVSEGCVVVARCVGAVSMTMWTM